MSKIKFWLFAFLACLSLAACGKTIHWKQEVLLQDGRVIEVDRVSKQTGKVFPENVILEIEQTISFKNPDTGEDITWTLPKGTMAKMLDFEASVPYFVLRAGSVGDYNTWGCPNPPFLVFRYENGQWLQKEFETLPTRFTLPNLLAAAHSADKLSEDGLVTIDEFKQYLKKSSIPEVRVIGREKINSNALGCFPSVLEKLGRSDEITEKYYRKGEGK